MTHPSKTRADIDSQTAARLRLIVTRLARAVRQHGAAGLTPSQISALATIESLGVIRISDLAARESLSAPVATRIVASIEEMGYLERIDDATDGRACLIRLTTKGQRVLKDLWNERTAGLTSRIEELSATDVALLRAALPVLEILAQENLHQSP